MHFTGANSATTPADLWVGAHRLVHSICSQLVYVRGQPLALRALEDQEEQLYWMSVQWPYVSRLTKKVQYAKHTTSKHLQRSLYAQGTNSTNGCCNNGSRVDQQTLRKTKNSLRKNRNRRRSRRRQSQELTAQVETSLTDLFDRLCMATAAHPLSPLGSAPEPVGEFCDPTALMSSLTLSPWPSPVSSPTLGVSGTCTDWDSEACTLASKDDNFLDSTHDSDLGGSFDSGNRDNISAETTSDDADWGDAMDQLVVRLESCALSAHPYRPMAAYSILMEIV
ncbi:hypothetical protein H4R35_001628 [Dimargaris xerosporica]|nr:hypothetical protein H4R35_001628 [Dimargaris xerosporica]